MPHPLRGAPRLGLLRRVGLSQVALGAPLRRSRGKHGGVAQRPQLDVSAALRAFSAQRRRADPHGRRTAAQCGGARQPSKLLVLWHGRAHPAAGGSTPCPSRVVAQLPPRHAKDLPLESEGGRASGSLLQRAAQARPGNLAESSTEGGPPPLFMTSQRIGAGVELELAKVQANGAGYLVSRQPELRLSELPALAQTVCNLRGPAGGEGLVHTAPLEVDHVVATAYAPNGQ